MHNTILKQEVLRKERQLTALLTKTNTGVVISSDHDDHKTNSGVEKHGAYYDRIPNAPTISRTTRPASANGFKTAQNSNTKTIQKGSTQTAPSSSAHITPSALSYKMDDQNANANTNGAGGSSTSNYISSISSHSISNGRRAPMPPTRVTMNKAGRFVDLEEHIPDFAQAPPNLSGVSGDACIVCRLCCCVHVGSRTCVCTDMLLFPTVCAAVFIPGSRMCTGRLSLD